MATKALSPEAEVAEIRQRIRALQDERKAIASTFIPIDAAIARVNAHVDALAASVIEHRNFYWYGHAKSELPSLLISTRPEEVEGLIAWLFTAEVKAKLIAGVREVYAGAKTLPEAGRESRAIAIDSEIFELEVAEERAIVAAEAKGMAINRRREASAAAILAA